VRLLCKGKRPVFDLDPNFVRNILGSYFNLIIAGFFVVLATGANKIRWRPLRYALAWPLYALTAIFTSAWVFAVIWNNIIEPVGWFVR
jgi:hypothetical protein